MFFRSFSEFDYVMQMQNEVMGQEYYTPTPHKNQGLNSSIFKEVSKFIEIL